MEPLKGIDNDQLVIEIASVTVTSTTVSPPSPPTAPETHLPVSASDVSGSGNSTSVRGGNYTARSWSSADAELWFFLELIIGLIHLATSSVGGVFSHKEGQVLRFILQLYTNGCIAAFPLICWDYYCLKLQASQQTPSGTFKTMLKYYRIGLKVLYYLWLWMAFFTLIHHNPSKSPISFWLCFAYLLCGAFCGIASPCVRKATCCIVVPLYIFSCNGALTRRRASSKKINALPTYKFQLNGDGGAEQGGTVGAGTAQEHIISGDEAVCSICSAKYANDEDLRKLPCGHLLHKECIDWWLKVDARCPICNSAVGNILCC